MALDDNQRQIIRNEEVVEAGTPDSTTVSQTQRTTDQAVGQTRQAAAQSTVQTTSTTAAPRDQVVSRNVAETYIDPAADRAAAVDWVNRLVWLVIGFFTALLVIRFALLAAGANESAGFAQLVYGLTGWLVAPFKGLFGQPFTYPGAAGTGVTEFESLLAAVVLLLIGFLITKIAQLALGTNRTTGTVVSETDRKVKY